MIILAKAVHFSSFWTRQSKRTFTEVFMENPMRLVLGGSVDIDSFFATQHYYTCQPLQRLNAVDVHLGNRACVHLAPTRCEPVAERDRITELDHILRPDFPPVTQDLPCGGAGGHHDHVGHVVAFRLGAGRSDKRPQ